MLTVPVRRKIATGSYGIFQLAGIEVLAKWHIQPSEVVGCLLRLLNENLYDGHTKSGLYMQPSSGNVSIAPKILL